MIDYKSLITEADLNEPDEVYERYKDCTADELLALLGRMRLATYKLMTAADWEFQDQIRNLSDSENESIVKKYNLLEKMISHG